MSDDLNALISKLESATEGSRELDAEIDALTNGRVIDRIETAHVPFLSWDGRYWYDECHFADPPRYTTSTDAAMTLVPKHCFVTVDKYLVSDESPDIWRAWIKWLPDENSGKLESVFSGLRRTPALALCIPALRARAATQESPLLPGGRDG